PTQRVSDVLRSADPKIRADPRALTYPDALDRPPHAPASPLGRSIHYSPRKPSIWLVPKIAVVENVGFWRESTVQSGASSEVLTESLIALRQAAKAGTIRFADRRKLAFLLPELTPGARILDLGCGGMWLTRFLRDLGFECTGIDLHPPADIVANIKDAGFTPGSF